MNVLQLEDQNTLHQLMETSHTRPVLIFKHSTRCSISDAALGRMQRNWKDETPVDFYLLDLLKFRPVSALIADTFGVEHQSPQVLLIKNGQCVYHESHMGISYAALLQEL